MTGGALFTLAELPGGAVLISAFDMETYFPTLAKISTSFKAPCKTDCYVELNLSEEQLKKIDKEATENGKAWFVLEMDLKDEKGVVVAQTKGTY